MSESIWGLDFDILSRKDSTDAMSQNQYCYPSVQTAQIIPQAIPQPVPITQQITSPPIPPQIVVEASNDDTYEVPEEYHIYEREDIFEIHANISRSYKNNKLKYTSLTGNDKHNTKEICIACFLIDNITKVIVDELEQDTVQLLMECRYYDNNAGKEEVIEITINEDALSNGNLITDIKNTFGSKYSPFPPKVNKITCELLSRHIINKCNRLSNTKHIQHQTQLNDISDINDTERKWIAQDFANIYRTPKCSVKLLLSVGFGASCYDKFNIEGSERLSCVRKTLIVYGCKSNKQLNDIAALSCTSLDNIIIRNLSAIKVTSNKDELRNLFFEHQYQPLFFMDDNTSDYTRKQNITKIQRITEYVCNGITRKDKPDILCTAVVFTNRKLKVFESLNNECVFINASDIPIQDYDTYDLQYIVSNFLAMTYNNIECFMKDRSEQITRILYNYDMDVSQRNIKSLYDVYNLIVKMMLGNYGISSEYPSLSFDRRRNSLSYLLAKSHSMLSDKALVKSFSDKLDSMIQNSRLEVRIYDKSLLSNDAALLYEHIGEPLLLLSNNKFEELFGSPVIETKALREVLNENGYLLVNCIEKDCFRLPIDERKLYTAIKVNMLGQRSIEKLPELHPVYVPDMRDGIERIYLANDGNGKPIYWPVGKIENRSVLVQGNTRMGKTFFVTTKLIMGFHELGYHVIIFDSIISSYSEYELGKCNLKKEFIRYHFCHGRAIDADDIMKEFVNSSNKVYIVNSDIDEDEKKRLCDMLFKHQKQMFNEKHENTKPLIIVFEEAGDSTINDTPEIKRIYNQGSKMKLSTITILQMFTGEGSQRFRRMVGQASLKVSFKCSSDHIRYFTEVIIPEHRATAKSKLPMLGVGEAIICGDFENADGLLYSGSFITKKD